jgi:hypothetical protein
VFVLSNPDSCLEKKELLVNSRFPAYLMVMLPNQGICEGKSNRSVLMSITPQNESVVLNFEEECSYGKDIAWEYPMDSSLIGQLGSAIDKLFGVYSANLGFEGTSLFAQEFLNSALNLFDAKSKPLYFFPPMIDKLNLIRDKNLSVVKLDGGNKIRYTL